MAGAHYAIDIDDDAIRKSLNTLLKKGTDLTPAFASIGEDLLISHHQRFIDHPPPDGEAWAPLSDATKAMKQKNVDSILVLNRILSSTLNYHPSPTDLLFGSPLVYAATHQFGRITSATSMIPNAVIPAREFLGVDNRDKATILDTLSDYLMAAP